MKSKFIVVLVASLMIATFGMVMIGSADSDGDVSDTGTISVSYKGPEATSFLTATTTAYDMYQAVTAVDSVLGFTANVSETNQSWVSGYNPNINYGTIDSITDDGTEINISNYHIYVYGVKTSTVNNVTVTTSGWYDALAAIGWMHPYADYSAYYMNGNDKCSLAVANIAISYGDASSLLSSIQTKSLVTIEQYDETYEYSFKISGNGLNAISGVSVITYNEESASYEVGTLATTTDADNNTSLAEQTIYGWGSNAYEALKNALGATNVIGQELYAELHTNANGSTYYTYYSWIDYILGSGTVSTFTDTSSTYSYWSSYTGTTLDATSYCSYTFGYYSGIAGAQNICSDFVLKYDTSTYYY